MKEIKFRVFNGKTMEYSVMAGKYGAFFINPESGDGLDPKDSASITPANTKYHDNIPVMQFIGLKDKNGKDIYCGDILKGQDNFIYRVWSVKGGFAVNVHVTKFSDDIKMDYPFPLQPLSDEQTVSYFESSCEIIGNVYENPELIK